MSTNDRFSKLRNIPEVKKAKEAAYNMLSMTTNYELFKEREGNRNGLQESRVKLYQTKIRANRFYPVLGAIHVCLVGKLLLIADGHHRFEALKREGKPIVFMVVEDYSLDEIADFNSSRSSAWKNEDNFASALTEKLPLAVALDELRIEMTSKYGINDSKMNVGDMYGILTQNIKFFGAGVHTVTREMYSDAELARKARSIEYQEVIDVYASLKQKFTNDNVHKTYKIVKVIMECAFENNKKLKNFDIVKFRDNLKLTYFDTDLRTVKELIDEIARVHNYVQKQAIALV